MFDALRVFYIPTSIQSLVWKKIIQQELTHSAPLCTCTVSCYFALNRTANNGLVLRDDFVAKVYAYIIQSLSYIVSVFIGQPGRF